MTAATRRIRAAVCVRADGRCENPRCAVWVGFDVESGEMDHAASRRVAQSVENCWLLCRVCHRKRTDNTPSAAHWLELFATHARRYGYSSEVARVESRLAFVTTRALLGAAS